MSKLVLARLTELPTTSSRRTTSRRRFVQSGLAAVALSQTAALSRHAWAVGLNRDMRGAICGEPTAEETGDRVLAAGGNVVDAIVASALTAAVSAIHQTGIGGYGGSMMLALDQGKTITSIDFNTTAPASMTADFFTAARKNTGTADRNQRHGWLASGVPGILAGLQLAINRFGSRSFWELMQPAIAIARDGFVVSEAMARLIKTHEATFRKDQGSTKLYLNGGNAPAAGSTFRNSELAAMLETLAQRNSVDSFYRGDIAQQIADCFQKHGGLVTTSDLQAYAAKEVKPLACDWGPFTIYTSPLTAGGLTMLQGLHILQAMGWPGKFSAVEQTHARIEVLRKVWQSRLTLLGDPEKSDVPVQQLLSTDFAHEAGAEILAALKSRKAIDYSVTPRKQGGTIHLSGFDADGNLAALTLTHGDSFGAQVTVDGLGLTLGHGMSRFESTADHPNSPGPGKRPLHNMCPTIVVRDGKPCLAAGGRGGRKIPNAMFEVLVNLCVLGKTPSAAISAPRMHTEGNLAVVFEKTWPSAEVEECRRIGYKSSIASSATVSAVGYDSARGEWAVAQR
jgi:gamma-glutamyltranspeptidase/glutathione hydrolase